MFTKQRRLLATTSLSGWNLVPVSVFAFGASLAIASGARAQTVLDPISVTATEVAPGGVQITPEQIDEANPTDIKDVFQGEAGVNVGGGSDVARKSYVNGLEDTNLNVKIDGARQVNSAFHHLGTVIIDPGLLKSVRIETGVGPADVGPGALGGSIAYETKDARDLLAPDQPVGGYLKTTYDTNPGAKGAALTLATRDESVETLMYASWDNGDDYENGDGVDQPGTSQKMKNFIGKFAFTSVSGGRFEVNGGHLFDEGLRPNRANFGALVNGAPPTIQEFKRSSLSFSYKDETPTALLNPELVLSVNRSQLFINDLAFGPFRFDLDSSTQSFSGKAANTFTTGLGIVENGSLTTGVDFYHDTGQGNATGGFGGGAPLKNTETSLNVGAFVQARLKFGQMVRLSAGGRYDQQWFDGIDDTDITSGGPSGNVNVEVDPLSGLTGYAGVGTTYGGIPLGESAIYNFAGQWTYDGLTSSRSYNYKLGIKGEKGPFSGDIHYYRNDIRDSHDRGSRIRNTTRDLESKGFNASASYNYGDGFIRATFSRNRLRSDDQFLVSGVASFHGLQTGDILTVGGAHEFAGTGIRIGASTEYAFRDDDNPAAPRDSYFVANIYGQWTPEIYQNLTLRLDVKNLLDETYVDRATSADADNAQAIGFKEPGRTFLLTARLTF